MRDLQRDMMKKKILITIGIIFTLSAALEEKNFSNGDHLKTLDAFAEYIAIPYDRIVGIPNKQSVSNDILHRAFISAENWWNEGTRTYSKQAKVSEIAPQYQPGYAAAFFELPTFWVDKNQVIITTAHPDPKIAKKYLKRDSVILPVHPEIIDDDIPHLQEIRKNPAPCLKAVPTSSSRSVIIDDIEVNFHSDKLNLPRKISRYYRNLGPKTIAHSVTLSKDLEHLHFNKFAYLPETIGVAFPTVNDQRGWGFIVREVVPRPVVSDKRLLIPFFALYADNPVIPNGDPLLISLIKSSKENPKNYILNRILFPLIESFIIGIKQRGILMELHGQNTLLEVNSKLLPTRIVHRDLDNFVDCGIRKSRGLSCENLHPDQNITPNELEPLGSPYSLIYDSSIGHHLLDYLASMMEKYFSISPEELQKECKKFFKRKFPDYNKYFPSTIYYYADKPIDPSRPNDFPLINTGQAPRWRPA